jgi:hypothetical protein
MIHCSLYIHLIPLKKTDLTFSQPVHPDHMLLSSQFQGTPGSSQVNIGSRLLLSIENDVLLVKDCVHLICLYKDKVYIHLIPLKKNLFDLRI